MQKRSIKKAKFRRRQVERIFKYEVSKRLYLKKARYERLPNRIKQGRGRRFINDSKHVKQEICEAPATFSLIENTTEVISYFDKAKKSLATDIPVDFDLSKIVKMGPETLTYLCAFINEDKLTHNTALKGNTPKDPKVKEMFQKSGFYNFVMLDSVPEYYSREIADDMIHRITREKVESELAGLVCKAAMKHSFDSEDFKKQNFYPILIECMANTLNHANYINKEEIYNWWLLAYKEPNTKITKFCFIDLGVGIFSSLEDKYKKKKLAELLKWFIPNKHKETLERIFKGERRTSTKNLRGRGQGLNYIYQLVKKDGTIKNFTLISNDIIAKIGYNTGDKIVKMNKNFIGTMYYWEIAP